MTTRPARPRRTAFTLPELLTVVVLGALLTTLLLASLPSARAAAAAARCEDRLKRLGEVSASWIGDHNQTIPAADFWHAETDYEGPIRNGEAWSMTFYRQGYLKSPGEVSCPLAPEATRYDKPSYGMNSYCGYSAAPQGSSRVWSKLPQIAKPAETFFYADAVPNFYLFIPTWNSADWMPSYSRHPESKANIAWADGHVSALTKSELEKDSFYYWKLAK